MQKQVQELLHKEMTRHEFLATLGLGVAALLGLSSVLKLLGSSQQHQRSSFGYGSSSYGK
jgi:hypothetical protein